MRYFDRLGTVLALPVIAAFLLPFAGLRPNRIAPPEAAHLTTIYGCPLTLLIAAFAVAALVKGKGRLSLSVFALAGWLALMGTGAMTLAEGAPDYARVSPGSGFWLGMVAFALLLADTLAKAKPGPMARLGILAVTAVVLALILRLWGDVSIMQEYTARKATFWA